MSEIYFAWVDASETTFNEVTHARYDENVFAFEIVEQEGDFCSLSVDLKNPRIGFLASGRKQWVWLARQNGSDVEALFFGRIVGIPEELAADVVRVNFIARPATYDADKRTLANSLKVFPFYDPVWINPELWDDPDAVLEARPAFWQVHRTTHELIASDIIEGTGDSYIVSNHNAFSLSTAFVGKPANKFTCRAEVRWENTIDQPFDLTRKLWEAFRDTGSPYHYPIISTYTGEGLSRDWPEKGDRIGSGWYVDITTLDRVDGTEVSQKIFPVKILKPVYAAFPLWSFRQSFNVRATVTRNYAEAVSFSFNAGVQAFAVDDGSDDVVEVNLSSNSIHELIDLDGSAYVAPMRDLRWRSYFQTDRGKQSLQYLVCLGRSRLLARARCIEVSCEVPFDTISQMTCNDNASIVDPRLPGGIASGKVCFYSLRLSEGQMRGSFTIACTIGTAGTLSTSVGTPTYVADGYAVEGYQAMEGGASSIADDIAFESYDTVPLNDDGIDLAALSENNIVQALTVQGGITEQEAAVGPPTWVDIQAASAMVNDHFTLVGLSLIPLQAGPFEREIPVTVSDLVIPKTLDLEAAS